jgi:hypothetical protein
MNNLEAQINLMSMARMVAAQPTSHETEEQILSERNLFGNEIELQEDVTRPSDIRFCLIILIIGIDIPTLGVEVDWPEGMIILKEGVHYHREELLQMKI